MKFNNYKYIIIAVSLSIFTSCSLFGKKEKNQFDENIEIIELDQLPMYGSSAEYGSIKKTPQQLNADRAFLENSDKAQPSRIQACIDYIEFGWYYLNQGDTEMAMRRANQAWQLDSTNPDVYVLFAAILNAQEDHEAALDMLDRGISMQPEYIALYDMYLSESIDLYRQTGDDSNIRQLVKTLDNLTVSKDSLKTKIKDLRIEATEFLKK